MHEPYGGGVCVLLTRRWTGSGHSFSPCPILFSALLAFLLLSDVQRRYGQRVVTAREEA